MKQLILLSLVFLMGATAFAEWKVVSVGKTITQESLFNYPALQELSRHSDQVWNQLVSEKGPVRAKTSLQDPKKIDPRVVQIYTSLIQLIESSRFDDESIRFLYGGTIRGPSYQIITGEQLSPLLRHIARSLALGLATVIYEKLDSAWTFVPTNILVGDLLNCAILNCDQSQYKSINPQFRRPRFSEAMLRYGKVYFYADALAVADFSETSKCDIFLDPRQHVAMVDALSDVQYKNGKTFDEVVFVSQCDRLQANDFGDLDGYRTRQYNLKKLAPSIAKAYVKKAFANN